MSKTKLGALVLSLLVAPALFFFANYAQASANLTMVANTVGTDNLIGATSAKFKFNVTTTAALARGDVFQFIFPTPAQAQPFSLSAVAATASSGLALYSALGGTPLSNLLTNPSFEPTSSAWTNNSSGTTTIATATPAFAGANAESLFATSSGVAVLDQGVNANPTTTYTISFYARGLNGGEKARLLLSTDRSCGAGLGEYYNFVSSTWGCASSTPPNLSANSSIVLTNTTTASYQRFSYTFTTPGSGFTVLTPHLAVGSADGVFNGQTVLYDAVQLETGTSTTAFNLGGTSPDTLGVGFGGAQNQVAYGLISTTTITSTGFMVTLGGITNASGQISTLQNLSWQVKAGTPAVASQPFGALSATKFSDTSTLSLARAGGPLISDLNSAIVPSSYATSAAASYTFSITATSSIPSGGKVVVNFPSEYNLGLVTVNLAQTISNHTTTTVDSFTTSTGQGNNKVILTTAGPATNAGDKITVVIGGITNPSTPNAYRPFTLYTAKANNGLLDGSYFGFESGDYGGGAPPPIDTIHIGGHNNIVVQVFKQSGGVNAALSGSELTQVKVNMGCPDKQFFVGEKWLDASSTASYSNLLDCNYMIGSEPFSKGDNSFYNSFLPPAFKNINASGGVSITTSIIFGVPDATVLFTITGGVSGQNAFVHAFSSDFESFSPVFNDNTYLTNGFTATGTGYVRLKVKSGQNWGFNVQGGAFGSGSNFTVAGVEYWPPLVPPSNIVNTGTTSLGNFPYVQADKALVVSLTDTNSSPLTNVCVGVKRSGGGMFMGAQDVICQPNSGNNYIFKVPVGTITVEVMRPGFGQPADYPVAISAATTTKSIALSAQSHGIVVTVQDGSATAINGAPVFAHGSNGFGQSITGSSGTTTIYVPDGTYTVEGFAPGFGQLTSQSATVSGGNASVTFTVSSANFKTISGQVTVGGTGASGIKIGARGTGSTAGGNGTETDSSGNYTLYVPPGTYAVGGWSPDTGGMPEQNVDVSSANESNENFTIGGQGTLHLTILNSSSLDPLFGGAFNASTGRGNGTNSWTTSGTSKVADIKLPAGSYDVHVGSPATGEITSGATATITANVTTNKTYDASSAGTLVTLSGTVSSSGSGVANVTVWASRIGAPGFYSTQTDSSGAYSLKVANAITYHMGVKSLGYVASSGDIDLPVSGNTTQNFTLIAAGSTISGTIKNTSAAAIASAWVSARKTISGNDVWTGGPTDANGAYSLNVDSGTWTVFAEGPCYNRSTGVTTTAGSSGVNITLAATAGCSVPTPEVHGITAASGGTLSKNGLTLDIPANALGTGQTTVSVSIATTSVVVSSPNATPTKKAVQTISATDSSGEAVTTLNSNASISIPYDPADLPNGFSESTIQLGYFDTNTGQWESVAATVDTVNHKLTASISHFTDYGPILPGVPSQITGLTASAGSASQINLSWTADSAANYYTIYRSLTNSNFTTSIATTTATSYSNTGLSASTQYYYKVAGVNTNGEGSSSASANATTNATTVSGGGGSSWVAPPAASNVTSPAASTTTSQTASTTTTTVATTPPVTATANATTAVEATSAPFVSVTQPDSLVTITPPSQPTYKPGAAVKFTYVYKNSTNKKVKVRVSRQLLTAKGKVVSTVPGTLTLKPGEMFKKNATQPLSGRLAPGTYTIRVRVLDSRGKQVLAENAFAIVVQKSVVKSKAKK